MGRTGGYDIAIVGGGIVGLATARALLGGAGRPSVVLLEAESGFATHQTGHNSGVIHSGLYYRPGSSRARMCVAGRDALYRYCESRGIAHERCGKLVVACSDDEVPRLRDLERRGRENGLEGLRRLNGAEAAELEPGVRAVEALHVPQTGIVDFGAVAAALVEDLRQAGAELRTAARVTAIERRAAGFVIGSTAGEVESKHLVGCAGLHSDRLARMCGLDPGVRIVPFRGEYYRLDPRRRDLLRDLVYPVPDPRFPFLGVHLTRTIRGEIEAGPNAVLAFSRNGYRRSTLTPGDVLQMLGYAGFWKLGRRHWRTAIAEGRRAFGKTAFVEAARRLVPAIEPADLERHRAGVRAQAVAPDGALVDDFRIVEGPGMLHVVNAPSPAATACLAIGEHVAERAVKLFDRGG